MRTNDEYGASTTGPERKWHHTHHGRASGLQNKGRWPGAFEPGTRKRLRAPTRRMRPS
ncbi:hypothetical protein B0H19DRAFT_1183667, partial [Mycena capillaripes]